MKTIKKWIYKFQYIITGFLTFVTSSSFICVGKLLERESIYSILFQIIGFIALFLFAILQFNVGYKIANKTREISQNILLEQIEYYQKENSRLRNKMSEDNKNENKNSW